MNYQTAAVVACAAFVLSFLAGLLGGVPFFDLVVRALFWAAFGFGGCLGAEALLRSLVPDLFSPKEEVQTDAGPERAVDITLDDVPSRGGFIEEVDEDEEPVPRYRAEPLPSESPGEPSARGSDGVADAPADGDEEMPEIGSFLDAFKPNATDDDGVAAKPPEFGEYTPVDQGARSRAGRDVTMDGEVQDPVILAKAVQTVMKRDVQGN